MKYTKAPLGLQKYWVKIKKSGSKYWKVVPLETALSKIKKETGKVKIKGTEVTINVPKKNSYEIVYI